jgi:Flp pilus assembly protein TadB
VLGPLLVSVGNRAARLVGAGDELSQRLARIDAPVDAATFRARQVTKSALAFVTALAATSIVDLPLLAAIGLIIGAPILTFLIIEQRTLSASTDWQRRLGRELPVVAEQLGMLLSSGYSMGGAIARVSERGDGVCATAFERVTIRVRQGLSDIDALHEWAALAQVPALDRLVRVLELNFQAADLGELISAEARATRREAQRTLEELIERRSQMVWIPVTVATLVPGVIFMAVPFVDAMGKLTGR